MLPRLLTHQRRQWQILSGIERESARARVIWNREELGTWEEIGARCFLMRGRIHIRFEHLRRGVEFRVVSLRLFAEGVRVFLSGLQGSEPEEMIILLQEPRHRRRPRERLLGVAQAWLDRHAPGAVILHSTRRLDLGNSLSGCLLRVHARHAGQDQLVLVSPSDQSGDRSGEILTQALVWASALARNRRLLGTPRLVLLVPSDRSAVAGHRARYLSRACCLAELWEYDPDDGARAQPAPPPPPPREYRDFRWPVLGPFRWSAALAQVMDLAPAEIRRYPRFQEYDSLRLRGLEFARVEGLDRDRITFGVGTQRHELTADNLEALEALVEGILYFRRADTPNAHHPLYRMQAERWLESSILDRCGHLFPELAPGSLYSQIPVYLGDRQGRVDILGADKEGTLVVMELKVSEDVGLPLQALDYWGRVIEHNQMGDFEKRGYFSEVRLNRERPRIYLVSPVFSFHDTTETILEYVDPGIEIWKIAVNVDWRCGVKVLSRTRVKGRQAR